MSNSEEMRSTSILFILFVINLLFNNGSSVNHIIEKRQLETVSQSSFVETSTQNINAKLAETCPAEQLTSSHLTTVKVLLFISSGWMAAWCMLTTVVNIIFNEFSMTRFFEIYQEFGFTVLFIFLGAFTYQTDSRGLCIATQIIILFFINFVSTIFVVMSFLATCLIRNVIEHLTSFHWVIGFVLPILVATISVIAGYFSCSDFFGLQAPHCFAYTRTKQFWSFVVPVWILFLALNCANIYSFTMCKLSRLEEINLSELYWAFKTCKVTTLLFAFTMTAYFSLMFAADIQLVWLHVLYFVTTLLLAPMIFISHTFTHVQTCISLFALTSLPFYKPCPPPSQTKHEQDFGLIFSLRMKIPFTNAPPNTAEDFVPPTVIQYSEHVMEEMLVIETPPLLRTNKRRPKRFLTNQTVFNLQPPPIVNW